MQFLKSKIIVEERWMNILIRIVMSAEYEESFQLSNKCYICDELFDRGDNTVRDHCHITGK